MDVSFGYSWQDMVVRILHKEIEEGAAQEEVADARDQGPGLAEVVHVQGGVLDPGHAVARRGHHHQFDGKSVPNPSRVRRLQLAPDQRLQPVVVEDDLEEVDPIQADLTIHHEVYNTWIRHGSSTISSQAIIHIHLI